MILRRSTSVASCQGVAGDRGTSVGQEVVLDVSGLQHDDGRGSFDALCLISGGRGVGQVGRGAAVGLRASGFSGRGASSICVRSGSNGRR